MNGVGPDLLYPQEPTRFSGKDISALLIYCVQKEVSDVTIQTDLPVWVEIHGRLHRITKRSLTNAEVAEIICMLFGNESATSRLNGAKDLDCAYDLPVDRGKRLRFRVNATGILSNGHTGISITIRTIDAIPPLLSKMNVEEDILLNIAPKQGLVLVTGSTGSGKSTLLSGVIRWLIEQEAGNRKVLTYEHPIEFVYDEVEGASSIVSQSEVGKHIESFAAGVRNALRRKPMVILVGEARDKETIGECITASMTGHLTFSTVHSNGVADTIRRMVNVFDEGEKNARALDIVSSLKLIVSQMLIPSTDGRRVALREYLVFNEQIVDKLLSAGPENMTLAARNILKTEGQTFLADANKKFKEGRIDEMQFKRIKQLTQGVDKDMNDLSK